MGKTRRDLWMAIADLIGGERGKRMQDSLRHSAFAELLDRPVSDDAFAAHLESVKRDLPRILADLEDLGPEDPGSWGFPN